MDLALKIIRWFIWVVCSGLIGLNLFALYVVLFDSNSHINNKTDPSLAFYMSREFYITLLVLYMMSLFAMIYFSYKRTWHIFFVSLLVALILLFVIFRVAVVTPAP